MTENDTVRLLRECRAGLQMGVLSLEDVLPHIKNKALRSYIKESKTKHERLENEVSEMLEQMGEPKKGPALIAKWMASMKTFIRLWWHRADSTIASLITDGCHMGVKSLSRYLCEYPTASDRARAAARRIIALEDDMALTLRAYLG